MRNEWVYLLGAWYAMRSIMQAPKTSLETTSLRWPVVDDAGVRAGRITQEFSAHHVGVDVSVPGQLQTAKATVRAIAAGRVAAAAQGSRGWAVLLDHEDWASGYLHLAGLAEGIVDGALVKAGQALGPMGADPLDAERIVHLHLQIAPGGHAVDPAPYLARAV
jgi:murein DD-endopeptidase MepM/ murein hydrolase activator NlpD